jgi:hypothetical protein
MTTAQKKKRFRELAKQDRIQTGRQLVSEREQPFLPFNEFLDVQRRKSARPGVVSQEGATMLPQI